jgi:hypothetical protein
VFLPPAIWIVGLGRAGSRSLATARAGADACVHGRKVATFDALDAGGVLVRRPGLGVPVAHCAGL